MSSHRSSTRGTFSRSSSVKTKVGSASILQGDPQENELIDLSAVNSGPALEHERKTAPLFTRAAYIALGGRTTFPARGLLGAKLDDSGIQSWQAEPPKSEDSDSRLYVNINAPFSAVICGVQGSGKSHTAAVLLENMLIRKHDKIGTLRKPLSGLVLHFGEGGPSSLPSEAAWVGVPNDPTTKAPEIQVFVSKSSFSTMGKVYEKLGLKGLVVRPLLFTEAELDAQAFLTMMAIWSKEMTPLYVQVILSLLRELGEEFTYQAFLDRLRAKKRELQATQLNALKQRLDLLDAFVDKESTNRQKRYAPGRLTIIDLSDPFIDATSACSIFEILTRQFAREDVGTGKVLLVDEAHKYLQVASTNALSGLTKELSSLIRQQRHLAMRVLISTQEPTVIPSEVLSLCNVAILHRFSSPAWWDHLSRYVPIDITKDEAHDKIVQLPTGQAIVICATALIIDELSDDNKEVKALGREWLSIKTRKRVTKDGGRSILVVG